MFFKSGPCALLVVLVIHRALSDMAEAHTDGQDDGAKADALQVSQDAAMFTLRQGVVGFHYGCAVLRR